MRPNEVSCILYILTVHIPIYRLHNVFFIFFNLIVMTIVYPQTSLFLMDS